MIGPRSIIASSHLHMPFDRYFRALDTFHTLIARRSHARHFRQPVFGICLISDASRGDVLSFVKSVIKTRDGVNLTWL